MKITTKKVNIYPTTPIYALNPVVRSVVCNVTKSVSDIRKCLIAKAKVEEILDNGTVVQLNLFNYDKDNSVKNDVEIATKPVVEDKTVSNKTESKKSNKATTKVEEPVKEEVVEEKAAEPAEEVTETVEAVEEDDDVDEDDKYGL